jgi:hypothetical protein
MNGNVGKYLSSILLPFNAEQYDKPEQVWLQHGISSSPTPQLPLSSNTLDSPPFALVTISRCLVTSDDLDISDASDMTCNLLVSSCAIILSIDENDDNDEEEDDGDEKEGNSSLQNSSSTFHVLEPVDINENTIAKKNIALLN